LAGTLDCDPDGAPTALPRAAASGKVEGVGKKETEGESRATGMTMAKHYRLQKHIVDVDVAE